MAKISELEESRTLEGLYTIGSVPVKDAVTGAVREETRKVSLEFLQDASEKAEDALDAAGELDRKYQELEQDVDDLGKNVDDLGTSMDDLKEKVQDIEAGTLRWTEVE